MMEDICFQAIIVYQANLTHGSRLIQGGQSLRIETNLDVEHARRPVIGITLGDPAGIGPEVVLKALQDEEVYTRCVPIVIGNADVLRRCSEAASIQARPIKVVDSPRSAQGTNNFIELVHVEVPGMLDIRPGKLSREAGAAADAFVRRACDLAIADEIDAIATAPINKESLRLAEVKHIGHTEMLAAYLGASDPLTLLLRIICVYSSFRGTCRCEKLLTM